MRVCWWGRFSPTLPGELTLAESELPQDVYEREIPLPQSVMTENYTSSLEDGVLSYTFHKRKKQSKDKDVDNPINIPFHF
ncbi:Hsp20 family protein [Bacillaceae bacterium S4-13-58]